MFGDHTRHSQHGKTNFLGTSKFFRISLGIFLKSLVIFRNFWKWLENLWKSCSSLVKNLTPVSEKLVDIEVQWDYDIMKYQWTGVEFLV